MQADVEIGWGPGVIGVAGRGAPVVRSGEKMQYILLIYGNEALMQSAGREAGERVHAGYGAYTGALQEAKVMVGGERLRPTSAASTVRVAGGKTQVLDGPYAETKEQLGGYYLIDFPDLDAALSWAARCPGAAHGVIEVRPIWPM